MRHGAGESSAARLRVQNLFPRLVQRGGHSLGVTLRSGDLTRQPDVSGRGSVQIAHGPVTRSGHVHGDDSERDHRCGQPRRQEHHRPSSHHLTTVPRTMSHRTACAARWRFDALRMSCSSLGSMANVALRPGTASDRGFLREMLYEAVWPVSPRPPITALDGRTDLLGTLPDWSRRGDGAVIADCEGVLVGAAWYRLFTVDDHAYGFVDAETPELGIAVRPDWRGRGIGRSLLSALVASASVEGHPRLSLCTERGNARALHVYESLGFRIVGSVPDTDDQGIIMATVRHRSRPNR